MSATVRTRKRREPGWVDATVKVLEPLSAAGGRPVELELKEILRQIQEQKLKTIKGSIDERDSLQRSLEQSQEIFYIGDSGKFGLVKFRPSPSSVNQNRTKKNEKRGRPSASSFSESTRNNRSSPNRHWFQRLSRLYFETL